MGYLANFMVYTLAMVGVIVVALLIFKSATSGGITGGKSKYLKIIDTLNLAPRKTLYIVSTGREKFLIAGDVDKTSLISKLQTAEDCGADVSRIDFSTSYEMHNDNLLDKQVSQVPSPRGKVREGAFQEIQSPMTFQETMSKLPKPSFMDKSDIGIKSSMLNSKNVNRKSVMRNLVERMK
ncbi:hypothetical protein EGQ24_07130 [bacterium]|nr:hypothetical protein [bacterium]